MEHENPKGDTSARPENGGVRIETPSSLQQLELLIEPHAMYGGAVTPITPDMAGATSILDMQELYDPNEIQMIEKVGHGSYGTVYKAVLRDRLVAVKEFQASAETKAIETEVKQLSRVSHPNIIALYGVSFTLQSKYLIMEFAEGGSLHNFLHGKVKPFYTTAHAMSWARQCAEGVEYLHAMKPKPLIHRDLKPLNLLLTDKGRHLKICDFGTVVDKSTFMTNNKGSAAWMAPEVFESQKYTEKCDIFSWGIVLWEVLTRQQPFKEIDNPYTMMWKIHSGHRPPLIDDIPEAIQNLMTACWSKVPDQRPPMSEVVELMSQLALAFTGADEPLEYEFVNQQIIRPAGSTDDQSNYTMDFSSFNSSANNTTLTQIASRHNASSTSDSTSTDELGSTSSGDYLPPQSSDGEQYCPPIPEEPTDVSSTSNSDNAFQGDSDAVGLQSIESETSTAKSDGKSLLTVTDTKQFGGGLPPNNTIATGGVSSAERRFTMNPPFGYESAVESCDGTADSDNIDDDDENDGPDQSLHEILDPDLQPEPPIAGHKESEQIYREHRRLAKQYLQLDTQLYYAQDRKEKLLKDMDPLERQHKEDLLTKMRTKEELLVLYKSLSSQLERMRELEQQQPQPPGECDDDWVLVNTSQPKT